MKNNLRLKFRRFPIARTSTFCCSGVTSTKLCFFVHRSPRSLFIFYKSKRFLTMKPYVSNHYLSFKKFLFIYTVFFRHHIDIGRRKYLNLCAIFISLFIPSSNKTSRSWIASQLNSDNLLNKVLLRNLTCLSRLFLTQSVVYLTITGNLEQQHLLAANYPRYKPQ